MAISEGNGLVEPRSNGMDGTRPGRVRAGFHLRGTVSVLNAH